MFSHRGCAFRRDMHARVLDDSMYCVFWGYSGSRSEVSCGGLSQHPVRLLTCSVGGTGFSEQDSRPWRSPGCHLPPICIIADWSFFHREWGTLHVRDTCVPVVNKMEQYSDSLAHVHGKTLATSNTLLNDANIAMLRLVHDSKQEKGMFYLEGRTGRFVANGKFTDAAFAAGTGSDLRIRRIVIDIDSKIGLAKDESRFAQYLPCL